jgi:hypothetical protein
MSKRLGVDRINSLPEDVREWIHDLETNADPAGTLAELRLLQEAFKAQELLIAELKAENVKLQGRREHTQNWYASHYAKLHDWARKVLPEPYRNQFFSCVANGTYDAMLDCGEPYMCNAGFMVTPSGYIHMDDAKGQIIREQTARAEKAEEELLAAKAGWIEIKEGCELPEYGDMVTIIDSTSLGGHYQEVCDWNLGGDWTEAKQAGVIYWKPLDWPTPPDSKKR